MLKNTTQFNLKRTLSTLLSIALSILTALPLQVMAQEAAEEKYDINFQPRGNNQIILRDRTGKFLGYARNDAVFSKRGVPGSLVNRYVRNGAIDKYQVIQSLSTVKDEDGRGYVPMNMESTIQTVEGTVIPAGTDVILDLRYFWNDQVQPRDVDGPNNQLVDDVNNAILEQNRLNPPTEPMEDEGDGAVESDEEPLNPADLDTFARGADFPTRFLSTPLCGCPAGNGCRISDVFGTKRGSKPKTIWKNTKTGMKKSYKRVPVYHQGYDIAAYRTYGAQVVAAADGIVTYAGPSTGGYGTYVEIDHGNGFKTRYGHMRRGKLPAGIRKGAKVSRGTLIGYMGTTGRSSGIHLHFEVRQGSKAINPRSRMLVDLQAPGSPALRPNSCNDLPEYPEIDSSMDRALGGALSRRTSGGRASPAAGSRSNR